MTVNKLFLFSVTFRAGSSFSEILHANTGRMQLDTVSPKPCVSARYQWVRESSAFVCLFSLHITIFDMYGIPFGPGYTKLFSRSFS